MLIFLLFGKSQHEAKHIDATSRVLQRTRLGFCNGRMCIGISVVRWVALCALVTFSHFAKSVIVLVYL